MTHTQLHIKSLLALVALTTVFTVGAPASAQQSATDRDNTPATDRDNKTLQNDRDNRPVQDSDATRREQLAQFDRFLDGHPEIAEQLRKDPSLVNNKAFVEKHPALQTFLQDQPAIRADLRKNPTVFMRQENNFDRREDRGDRDSRADQARFDHFLDSHREIAEQVRKNPSLVNNKDFVDKHPELQAYLQQQPAIRDDIRQNPDAFTHPQAALDNRDDRQQGALDDRDDRKPGDNRDVRGDRDNRADQARFDRFLDSHHEIAEQVRKNPSLVNNKDFVDKHPELQAYLQQQPAIRDDIRQNPDAFTHPQTSLDNRDDRQQGAALDGRDDRKPGDFDNREGRGDRDTAHGQASFKEFLGGHSDISRQLSKDPSLVRNQEYLTSHPELQEYLKANPGVRDQLMQNPQSFVKTAQPGADGSAVNGKAPTTTTTTKPKP